MARILSLAVSTLLAVSIHAQTLTTNFVASKDQAYTEVSVDGRVQKLVTEYYGDNKALLVLGEKNNPEVLKFSFVDESKKVVSVVVEFRTEKGSAPAGLDVAGNEFIKSLSSDAEGFADWQAQFAAFPEQVTEHLVLTDPSFADPVADEVIDGNGGFVFRIRDKLCKCREGFATVCLTMTSIVRCVLDNLCTVWDCLRSGEWTPQCSAAWQTAVECASLLVD